MKDKDMITFNVTVSTNDLVKEDGIDSYLMIESLKHTKAKTIELLGNLDDTLETYKKSAKEGFIVSEDIVKELEAQRNKVRGVYDGLMLLNSKHSLNVVCRQCGKKISGDLEYLQSAKDLGVSIKDLIDDIKELNDSYDKNTNSIICIDCRGVC